MAARGRLPRYCQDCRRSRSRRRESWAARPGSASIDLGNQAPSAALGNPATLPSTLDTNVVNATFSVETNVPVSRVVHLPHYPAGLRSPSRRGLLKRVGVSDRTSWAMALDVGVFVVGAFLALLLLMAWLGEFGGMLVWLVIALPLLWLGLVRHHVERRWS